MELHLDECVAMALRQSNHAWQAARALSATQSRYLMAHPRSQPSATTQRSPRILIIEDELLIALLIEEMVKEIGYRVSKVAYTIAMARQEFVESNFDAVLLDINIGGRYQPEIADFLNDRGVPFAFVTGYDYFIVPRHQTVPVLQKPFTAVELRALLEELVGSGSPTGKIAQVRVPYPISVIKKTAPPLFQKRGLKAATAARLNTRAFR
jgi:CheY-like chemotaxis protein